MPFDCEYKCPFVIQVARSLFFNSSKLDHELLEIKYRLKDDVRFKPLEYLCEDMTEENLEVISNEN
jgi:hypothetical protein